MTDPLEGSLSQAQEMAAALQEENALLLRQRAALRERCIGAQQALAAIAASCRGDAQRVDGKAQGVGLALSYLDEYIAGRVA